ncbi:MAG: hypothetical protein U0W24_23885 [Bacteroidales bacterium]
MKATTIFTTFFVVLAFLLSCNGGNSDSTNSDSTKTETVIIDQSANQNKTEPENNVEDKTSALPDPETLSLKDESIVFSFETKNGKRMCLALGKDKKYLVYRFGKDGKVELQFPENLENSFENFTYNYYFRGGGASNMGLDLNYVSFSGDTHKIIIYEEYSSGDPENPVETVSVGLKIIDLKSGKENKIEGKTGTKQGSLIDFRDNGLIKVEEGEN